MRRKNLTSIILSIFLALTFYAEASASDAADEDAYNAALTKDYFGVQCTDANNRTTRITSIGIYRQVDLPARYPGTSGDSYNLRLVDDSNSTYKYKYYDKSKPGSFEVPYDGTYIKVIRPLSAGRHDVYVINKNCKLLTVTEVYTARGEKSPYQIKVERAALAEKKRLAKEAEKNRLAKEAENKRLAKIDEEKRLTKEAENKRLAKIEAENAIKRAKQICYADTSKAKERYTNCLTAARKGDSLAKINVASMYANGEGIKKNYTKSIYWYKESIKDGNQHTDHAKEALALVEELVALEKAQAKAQERERLADTWYQVNSEWNSGSGKFEAQCKAGRSPAKYSKSAGSFGGDARFEDEVSKDGKVMEVTVTSYNAILKQRTGTKFIRGIERCEAHVASKNRQRKAAKEAQDKALDKYR